MEDGSLLPVSMNYDAAFAHCTGPIREKKIHHLSKGASREFKISSYGSLVQGFTTLSLCFVNDSSILFFENFVCVYILMFETFRRILHSHN